MKKAVLFLQGAGDGAYAEDKKLVESLQNVLGATYKVHYPQIPDEGFISYAEWKEAIENALSEIEDQVILVGHSVGASVLIKYLTDPDTKRSFTKIFLLSTPFWGGAGWLYDGYEELELPKTAATELNETMQVYLYHAKDDEIVPFSHLGLYQKAFPQAIGREIANGGHQLNNDLKLVAEDMMSS